MLIRIHLYKSVNILLFAVGTQAGQAFFDPNNPQSVYVPQQPPPSGAPPYQQPPSYTNANNSAPPPPGFIPSAYPNGNASAPGFHHPGYPTGAQNGAQNGYQGPPPEGPPPAYSEKAKKMQ